MIQHGFSAKFLSLAAGAFLFSSLGACTTPDTIAVRRPAGGAVAAEGLLTGRDKLRSDPAYIQWLEKQSMLRQAPDLISIVSGTALGWRASSLKHDTKTLFDAAPSWMKIDPSEVLLPEKQPLLAGLLGGSFPESLFEMGVRGIYVSPASEGAFGWKSRQTEDGIVGFALSDEVGTVQQYAEWQKRGFHMAGDILPAAVGTGPDFLLALRAVREYCGLFMMAEVPQALWNLLPAVPAGTYEPIGPAVVSALASQGVIPAEFSADRMDDAPLKSGFAVTEEIAGVDGQRRRWVYRYAGSPETPVLNTDDPSHTADRLWAASAVNQVGILKQPLVGFRVLALWGQEASDGRTASPEPALTAMRSISRSVHRYGAWTFAAEAVAPEHIAKLQNSGADFVPDTLLPSALEAALLSGSAKPLTDRVAFIRESGIDISRLLHGNPDLYARSEVFEKVRNAVLQRYGLSGNAVMPRNGLDIGRRIAGIDDTQARKMADDVRQSGSSDLTRHDAESAFRFVRARTVHKAVSSFYALLPGLYMMSGHDLMGTLTFDAGAPLSAWQPGIPGGGDPLRITRRGIQRADMLYDPVSLQLSDVNSYASELKRVLAVRASSGVASARCEHYFSFADQRAFAVQSSDGGRIRFVTVINITSAPLTASMRMPERMWPGDRVRELVTGTDLEYTAESVKMEIPGYGVRLVRIIGNNR
ncbi:MAG: hypothetical protein J5855_02335 [Mailhella sp.]|nr:hypothetical protein [Mailhella sp.]